MYLWLKARRAPGIAASVFVATLVLAAAGELSVSLPAFGSLSGVQMPVALVAPVIVVLMLALGLATGDPLLEAVAARRIVLLDITLVFTATSASALLFMLVQTAGWSPLGEAASRNGIGLAGMMLMGRLLGSRIAALVPIIFLVFVAAFGSDGSGNPGWWGWPAASAASTESWAIAGALAVSGVLLAWRTRATIETQP